MTDHDGDKSVENISAHEHTASKGSCCNPHISLYISIAALLMAGYAVYVSNSAHDNSAMQSQVTKLESNVAGITDQLDLLNSQVQSNRENLVQTQLKKALENIRDIRNLAKEGTKAAISEVEDMLQNLTDMGDPSNIPEQSEVPAVNEVIKTLHNDTTADEPAATSPIKTNAKDAKTVEPTDKQTNSETSSSESILSELLDTASTNNTETTEQDANTAIDTPADSDTQNNKAGINLAPVEAPSGAQAF